MPSLNYCLSDDTFQSFRSHHLQLKTVAEDWERRQYFALRKKVFGDEQQLFHGEERDSEDFRSIGIIILCNTFAVADEVVGAVRIYRDRDDASQRTWFGGRLCVARHYRGHSGVALGMALVNDAVSRAIDLGCDHFLANVQPQNEQYFRRLHWQRIGEIQLHGKTHVRMQADLGCYPFMPRDWVHA